MKDKKKFFSIIIPVYNRAPLVAKTIESVLNQSFSDFEIITVDDGSSDDSLQVLNRYRDTIKIISQQNQGAEIARNNAVKHASGDYLVFLDSDDLLFRDSLWIYYQMITKENFPPLVFAQGKSFRNNDKPVESGSDRNTICYTPVKDYLSKTESAWLSTSFLVFKRSLWDEKTCFKKGTVDDLDFILRIGTFQPCIFIKSPATVAYRRHPGNSIHDVFINLVRLSNMLVLERNGEYPGGHERKMERMAVIGGHIFQWSQKGLKKRHYKESISLMLKGMPTVIAGALKKIKNRNVKPEIRKFQIAEP